MVYKVFAFLNCSEITHEMMKNITILERVPIFDFKKQTFDAQFLEPFLEENNLPAAFMSRFSL